MKLHEMTYGIVGLGIMGGFKPKSWRQAVRLTAVVVLPTPPFWLVMAMIFPID